MQSISRLAYAPSPALGRAGALVAVIFWGTSFVATKVLLRELSPIPIVFARSALGSIFLTGILLLRHQPLVPPRDTWKWLALMGFLGVFLQQALQAQALTLTSAMNTGWLIGLIPLWTAILARIFLGERFGGAKVAGLTVGFLGALVLVSRGELTARLFALPSTRGDLLVLLSTVNWAVYSVLGHGTLRRLGAVRATAGAMLVGWLFLVPLFLAGHGLQEFAGLSPIAWGSLLFLGLGCSGLGYLFWYGALERIEASRVAALLYLEPLVTFVAAALVLGEDIRALTLVGGLLVLTGVIVVQRVPKVASTAPTGRRAPRAMGGD
jgi:drug/metabolite transporter (DMT)-like permease